MRMALLFIFAALPAFAAPAPQGVLSTNRIHVGDRVELNIITRHGVAERVLIPDISRPPFIIKWESSASTEKLNDQEAETTSRLVFSSFALGEHRVSTNSINVLKQDGSEEFLPFPDVLIQVDSLLSNPPPELAEIKPPIAISGFQWVRPLLVIIAITLLAAIAAWFLRDRLRRKAKPSTERSIPPHEVALTALDALLKRQLIEQKEIEPFYVELSAIVRIYLEDRFNLRAPEQTTEEFIRTSSQSAALSLDHRTLTQSFLEQSDLVKFARYQPETDDMRRAWDAAAKLVRETIPAPAGAHP